MSIYPIMLQFHFERLIEVFAIRFKNEFGDIKIQEINNKIDTSKKVIKYLTEMRYTGYFPTSKGITGLLNTIPYFAFSKGETLCIGGLIVLLNWNVLCNKDISILEEYEVTKVASDIVMDCYKIKFKKEQSMFTLFFRDIANISKMEEPRPNENHISEDFEGEDFDYGDQLD